MNVLTVDAVINTATATANSEYQTFDDQLETIEFCVNRRIARRGMAGDWHDASGAKLESGLDEHAEGVDITTNVPLISTEVLPLSRDSG